MVVKENLMWILDRPHSEKEEMRQKWSGAEYLKRISEYENDKYRRNTEFVHSLGLKCDCVGWSNLDLTRPDAGEILDKIEAFCKEGGWLARGICSRWYEDFESDWYELLVPDQKEVAPHIDERFERGERRDVYAIRAYKNKSQPILLGWCEYIPLVASSRFREACINRPLSDVRFCWIRDVGRYASVQYFFLYPEHCIPRIACDHGLYYVGEQFLPHSSNRSFAPHGPGSEIYERISAISKTFSRVAEIFYTMEFCVQDYYPQNAMPKSGFAYTYHHETYWSREKVLIHKDTAEYLIGEKLLRKKDLHPVLFYDEEVPPGYVEMEMQPVSIPEEEHFTQMQAEYKAFLQIPRPVRKATTKEAVALLRKAKTARKADFKKRMAKDAGVALENTSYAPLIPYYSVADGGAISGEYDLYAYTEACSSTAEFSQNMAKEELLAHPIEGIVFACCADGDQVVLCSDGAVIRVSHETMDGIEDWPTLAQFFADCIELEDDI